MVASGKTTNFMRQIVLVVLTCHGCGRSDGQYLGDIILSGRLEYEFHDECTTIWGRVMRAVRSHLGLQECIRRAEQTAKNDGLPWLPRPLAGTAARSIQYSTVRALGY